MCVISRPIPPLWLVDRFETVRRQVFILTNTGLSSVGCLGTHLSEMLIELQQQ